MRYQARATIHDVSGCLVDFGKPHCYRALDLSNGLFDLEGADDRDELNRLVSKILFRDAAPTPAMRASRAWAAMRAGSRKVRATVRA